MPRPSHREQLLAGAVECLGTKGYARTTARDIAAASGANLASIGYHFGSKEALLNEAITRSGEEWAQRLGQIAVDAASPLEQMAASWIAMRAAFEEKRPTLTGFVEAVGQSAWSEDLRREMAGHYARVRATIAETVRASLGEGAEAAGADPEVVASFLLAVCDGLVLQWLLDPEATPTGEQLTAALGAALAVSLQDAESVPGPSTQA